MIWFTTEVSNKGEKKSACRRYKETEKEQEMAKSIMKGDKTFLGKSMTRRKNIIR